MDDEFLIDDDFKPYYDFETLQMPEPPAFDFPQQNVVPVSKDPEVLEQNFSNSNITTSEDIINILKNIKANDDEGYKYVQSEVELSYINTEIKEDIYNLNYRKLFDLQKYEFYNYNVLQQIKYTLQGLLKNSSDIRQDQLVKSYFRKLRRIGENSVYGNVFVTDFPDQNNLFLFKIKSNYNDSDYINIHEYFIGNILNESRKDIPNFVYTYGSFDCTAAIEPNNVFSYCKKSENTVRYIILENITNSTSLYNYIMDGCSTFEFMNVFLQIIYALNYANQRWDYTHYDLHADNILIKKYDFYFYIRYDTENGVEYLYTNTIAYIIDFGYSHIKFDNADFGVIGLENLGVEHDKSYQVSDIYRLLCTCLLEANNNNKALFNEIRTLIDFFDFDEDIFVTLTKQYDTHYYLPRISKYTELTYFDFTIFARREVEIDFMFEYPTDDKVLSCNTVTSFNCTREIDLEYNKFEPNNFLELRKYLQTEYDKKNAIQIYNKLKSKFVQDLNKIKTLINTTLTILLQNPIKIRFEDSEDYIEAFRNYIYKILYISDLTDQYTDNNNLHYYIHETLFGTMVEVKDNIENFLRYMQLKISLLSWIKRLQIPAIISTYAKNFYLKELPYLTGII